MYMARFCLYFHDGQMADGRCQHFQDSLRDIYAYFFVAPTQIPLLSHVLCSYFAYSLPHKETSVCFALYLLIIMKEI